MSRRTISSLLSRTKKLFRRSLRRRNNMNFEHSEALETRILPATIVVNSLADVSGDDTSITLREAIEAANNDSTVNGFYGSFTGDGADTIEFDYRISGQTIVLQEGPLQISSEITIVGMTDGLIVDGNATDRVLTVEPTGDATIEQVEFRNGTAATGGGINNQGTLELLNSIVTENNTTTSAVTGAAGIENSGDLTLRNTLVNHNHQNDPVFADTAAGIGNSGEVRLINSAVYENTGGQAAGAIYTSDGYVHLQGSSIYENTGSLAGGIFTTGVDVVLISSTLADNNGVGFVSRSDGNSTGLHYFASSTVIGNSGGIDHQATPHNTFPIIMTHSVVAMNNVDDRNDFEGHGSVGIDLDSSNNFIGMHSESATTGFTGIIHGERGNQIGTAATPLDPELLSSQTIAGLLSYSPRAGSPLIDGGIAEYAIGHLSYKYDQRGLPRITGTATDIGAVETNPQVTLTFVDGQHAIEFNGTEGNDAVVAVIGSERSSRLTLNQTTHVLNSQQFVKPHYKIDTADGIDQLRVVAPFSTSQLNPHELEVSHATHSLTASGAENIRLIGEPDGYYKTATMVGSSGDDLLVSREGFAWMSGDGYSNVVETTGRIFASMAGGHDTAQVDFRLSEQRVHADTNGLTDSGLPYIESGSVYVQDYEDATVWTNSEKSTTIYGSSFDDLFQSGPWFASLTTPYRSITVHGSNDMTAVGNGGHDTAILNDSPEDDTLTTAYGGGTLAINGEGGGVRANMYSTNHSTRIEQFAVLLVNSTSGTDTATLIDSPGDDVGVSTQDFATLRRINADRNDAYYVQVTGFVTTELLAGPSPGRSYGFDQDNDLIQIFDAPGPNHLTVNPYDVRLVNTDGSSGAIATRTTTASGFNTITVIGNNDAENTMDWTAPLYFTFNRIGDWHLR